MSIRRNPLIGDKKIDELEQTLIENLTVYKNLIKQINSIQPNLTLISILKENICWLIGNLERMIQANMITHYKMDWTKNILRVVCINSVKDISIMIIELIRNRLFHDNNKNIKNYTIRCVK